MPTNRIDASLSDTDRDAILAAIDLIESKLPFLEDLMPAERRDLPKMGTKSEGFVHHADVLARQDDSFLPRNFDLPEFQSDASLFAALAPIRARLMRLTEKVDDTTMLVGSEAYVAALIVYQNAQLNGRGEGFDALLDELSRRFARKTRKPDAPSTKP
jgi:hypothetical protein